MNIFKSLVPVSAFFIGAILTYFGTKEDIDHMKTMWTTAYQIGYDDGKKVSKAQYEYTSERLRQECMLLHFKEDKARRDKLGLRGLGE